MTNRLFFAAGLLLVASCASSPSQGGTSRFSNVITAEEIAATNVATAGDVIRQLRPNWLQSRGPVSITRGAPELPVIYVDEVRSSDPEALDRIARQIVFEIRYLNGRDATTLYGMGHGGGAIMVRTRR